MEIRLIENETPADRALNEDFFSSRRRGYIEVGPAKMCMPACYEPYCERIKNFDVRDDDVFIIAFPKSGTRWTNEMVWLILNNLDYEKAKHVTTDHRCPRLEQVGLFSTISSYFKTIEEIDKMDSPRCIGSHLHWTLLPNDIVNNIKHPKIIVILRSPQDTCLSFYYQNRAAVQYSKSFNQFCEMFLGERMPQGPFWTMTLGMWEQRQRPNILFIKYKAMKENMSLVINEVATFLGKTLSSDEIQILADHLSFDSMKKNESFNLNAMMKESNIKFNPFVRNGTVGEHKTVMSKEMQEMFEKRISELYDETGITFE